MHNVQNIHSNQIDFTFLASHFTLRKKLEGNPICDIYKLYGQMKTQTMTKKGKFSKISEPENWTISSFPLTSLKKVTDPL